MLTKAVFTKGLTVRTLKGRSSYVFCVYYNFASNLLVSGGCEGDVRIWNVAQDQFRAR
jgi:COMPASS component SWD3